MNAKTQNTKPAKAKTEAAPATKADPKALTPEQEAAAKKIAEKEAAAKAKMEAKMKKQADAAAAKAAKEAGKEAAAKAKAEATAAALKEKEEAKAAAAAKVAEATAKVGEQQKIVDDLVAQLDAAKKTLAGLKRDAKMPVVGSGSTALLQSRAKEYVRDTEHKTQSGNASVHCNDETANKLLGKTLDECYSIAATICEEDEGELRAKYGHLNTGMQRMNLGNKIRGVLNAK